jgi:hypothetical protein
MRRLTGNPSPPPEADCAAPLKAEDVKVGDSVKPNTTYHWRPLCKVIEVEPDPTPALFTGHTFPPYFVAEYPNGEKYRQTDDDGKAARFYLHFIPDPEEAT